jgi:hypothetical protein
MPTLRRCGRGSHGRWCPLHAPRGAWWWRHYLIAHQGQASLCKVEALSYCACKQLTVALLSSQIVESLPVLLSYTFTQHEGCISVPETKRLKDRTAARPLDRLERLGTRWHARPSRGAKIREWKGTQRLRPTHI